jgi:hypothetical protein
MILPIQINPRASPTNSVLPEHKMFTLPYEEIQRAVGIYINDEQTNNE